MKSFLSGTDRERVNFLVSIGSQVLNKLQVRFTEVYLQESVANAYYINCIHPQRAGIDAENVVDPEDPVNLAIVLIDALKQFHIKNQISDEPRAGDDHCMLVILRRLEKKEEYNNLLGFADNLPPSLLTDRAEHYVSLTATAFSGEPDYRLHRRNQILQKLRDTVAVLIVAGLFIAALYQGINYKQGFEWIAQLLVALMGWYLSYNLLSIEKPGADPAFLGKKFCSGKTGKNSCKKVLASPGSKLFGLISMAQIGVVYFSTVSCFIILGLLSGNYPAYLTILFWISLMPLPYTFFSLYYQSFVVKEFCKLCLGVQALLWVQACLVLFDGNIQIFNFHPIPAIALLAMGIASIYAHSIFETASWLKIEYARYKLDDAGFKSDPDVFDLRLARQGKIVDEPDLPGSIVLGTGAQVRLTAILSLMCDPCADMFNRLIKLHDWFGNEIEIAMFIIPDQRAAGVLKEVLSLSLNDQHHNATELLDAWYRFLIKNPGIKHGSTSAQAIEQWLQQQENSISQSSFIKEYLQQVYSQYDAWNKERTINYTPMLMLNGNLVPQPYYDNGILQRILQAKIDQAEEMNPELVT
jgi:uncharacterized membrane protein